MKQFSFLTFFFLLCLQPLRAQGTLRMADFSDGNIAPLKLLSSREFPAPNVEVVPLSDGPKAVGTAAVRLDDSESSQKQGYYSLITTFPAQSEGVLVARAFVRIPDTQLQGDHTAIDIRVSVGGKGTVEEASTATYLRIQSKADHFIWLVYDTAESKHRPIGMNVIPGDWYAVEQRIDVQNKTYDWSIENISDPSSGEKTEGKNEAFFQMPETLSFLTFASLERGGAIEIANILVERVEP